MTTTSLGNSVIVGELLLVVGYMPDPTCVKWQVWPSVATGCARCCVGGMQAPHPADWLAPNCLQASRLWPVGGACGFGALPRSLNWCTIEGEVQGLPGHANFTKRRSSAVTRGLQRMPDDPR